MQLSTHKHSGFTLIEMMIVMSMIAILFSMVLFPYSFYMDRARVDSTLDTISQGWIIAHTDIQNGLLTESGHHAHLFLHFPIGANQIDLYTTSGTTAPSTYLRSISLQSGIKIRSFSGIVVGTATGIIYHIAPPYAVGTFSTGMTEASLTGVSMIFGYDGASLESGRARKILLRPL